MYKTGEGAWIGFLCPKSVEIPGQELVAVDKPPEFSYLAKMARYADQAIRESATSLKCLSSTDL